MVSINRRTLYGEVYNDVRCLSSDEKPTEGIKNGSTLIEIDTGKRYLYDALSGSWNEFSQGGGSGEYVLPTMSQSVKGGATLGDGLSMSGDSLSVDYSKVASKQSLDDATKVDPDGGLKRTTDGLSADYSKVASVESLESATKLEADGGIKRTSNGLSIDYSEVASVDALEEATALSPTGGIVSTQDGLAISPEQSSTGAIDGTLLELTAKSKPATQQTTTGKNLYFVANGSSNGITYTNTDKGVSIYGTSTNEWSFVSRDITGDGLAQFTGKTLTLSCDASSSQDFYTNVKEYSGTTKLSEYVVGSVYGTMEPKTFTIGNAITRLRMEIGVRNSGSVLNMLAPIQLELGSTATAYEPYTGGAPSPSPDYPQEIVTVRGRNLVSRRLEDLYINGSTAFVASTSGTVSFIAKVDRNTDYTLSYTGGNRCIIGGVSSENPQRGDSVDSIYAVSVRESPYTFNSGSNDYVMLYLAANVDVSDVQLELGSAPQPYVPYGHVGLEARGKNLLDGVEQGNSTSSGVDADSYTRLRNKGGFIEVNPSTKYVVNITSVSDNVMKAFVNAFNSKSQSSATTASGWQSLPITFTTKDTERYLRVGFAFQDDSQINPNDVENPQLTEISVISIPLPSRGWVAGLPDGTADALTVDGAGKVVWELDTSEVVLDGSVDEEWYTVTNSASGKKRVYSSKVLKSPLAKGFADDATAPSLCTHYVRESTKATMRENKGFSISPSSTMYVYDDDFQNAQSFATWLQSNPVTVLYPLATPTTEVCGYVDLPDMQDCVLSIPELDALGVRYTIGDGAEIARQWYQRAHSEYEDRLSDLEQTVAQLVAGE